MTVLHQFLPPWEIEPVTRTQLRRVADRSGRTVAIVDADDEAARLVAAAPDLYQSLQEVLGCLVGTGAFGLSDHETQVVRRADAVLARVEGLPVEGR